MGCFQCRCLRAGTMPCTVDRFALGRQDTTSHCKTVWLAISPGILEHIPSHNNGLRQYAQPVSSLLSVMHFSWRNSSRKTQLGIVMCSLYLSLSLIRTLNITWSCPSSEFVILGTIDRYDWLKVMWLEMRNQLLMLQLVALVFNLPLKAWLSPGFPCSHDKRVVNYMYWRYW